MTVRVRPARPADVEAIRTLVEAGYRGEGAQRGWTTEAHLVGGARTSAEEVAAMVAGPGGGMLVAEQDGAPVGCCQLTRRGPGTAYFGMFAVRPDLQGAGLGRALLSAAEATAAGWGCRRMVMWVIRQRPELLAWYARRGYADTGERVPFPCDEPDTRPLVADLEFVVLAKDLTVTPGPGR